MPKFTAEEKKITTLILLVLVVVSFFNFRVALRRSRDAQRRDDVGAIVSSLEVYHGELGIYPFASDNGKIRACLADGKTLDITTELNYYTKLDECPWGESALADLSVPDGKIFMGRIPVDPQNSDGVAYYYRSNGRRIQLYAHLEGGLQEEGYQESIAALNLPCGNQICNYGRSVDSTPLDKSIEMYENELLEANGN